MTFLVLDFYDLSHSMLSEFPRYIFWSLTHVGNGLAIIPSSIVLVAFLLSVTKYPTKVTPGKKS